MTTKIRHVFQPREEVEVSEQEAQVLKAQGLLFEGDLGELLASDPTGPLDPPHVTTAPTAPQPAKSMGSTSAAAAAAKES